MVSFTSQVTGTFMQTVEYKPYHLAYSFLLRWETGRVYSSQACIHADQTTILPSLLSRSQNPSGHFLVLLQVVLHLQCWTISISSPWLLKGSWSLNRPAMLQLETPEPSGCVWYVSWCKKQKDSHSSKSSCLWESCWVWIRVHLYASDSCDKQLVVKLHLKTGDGVASPGSAPWFLGWL